MVKYRTVDIEDFEVFYREAGELGSPALLLLHGFPSSSHMFRGLIPLLDDRYRVVAPDLPGFGFSEAQDGKGFEHTFDRLAEVTDAFTQAVGLDRYALYVFDYGAPAGFRLALRHPERIAALISQNGNAYEEGLSEAWDPVQRYWRDPSAENRSALRDLLLGADLRSSSTRTELRTSNWSPPSLTRSPTRSWTVPAMTRSSST